MTALHITGYLASTVTDSKHRSAREAIRLIKSELKKAGVTGERTEVLKGEIFLSLKDDVGVEPVEAIFKDVEGVKVSRPTAGQLVFSKERARAALEAHAVEKGA